MKFKNVIIFILLFLLFILSPVYIFAAGSSVDCTTTAATIVRTHGGNTWIEVTCAFTADDGDGSIPSTAIPYDLTGTFLYMIAYYYDDTTAVTDNSDMTLTQGSGSGYDILYGGGSNVIDESTNNQFQPLINSTANAMPIYDTLYINITGNSVNSAEGVLVLKFVQ